MDMNAIVGTHDIVLLTLDTLRYDVAQQELEAGNLLNFSRFIDHWEPRHSPGSFTYAAHHAMFAGFFPTPINNPLAPRTMSVDFHGSRSIDGHTKVFDAATIVEGLANSGYHTLCVGGVGFFNKQTPLGSVLPNLFQQSYWAEDTGVTAPQSTEKQVEKSLEFIIPVPEEESVFLFINVSAIHQPNYFYDDKKCERGSQQDDISSHAAALRYVDSALTPLFNHFQSRKDTLFIVCSDHGTCYGEDGYEGHRIAHEVVWTVPYAEFVVKARL